MNLVHFVIGRALTPRLSKKSSEPERHRFAFGTRLASMQSRMDTITGACMHFEKKNILCLLLLFFKWKLLLLLFFSM